MSSLTFLTVLALDDSLACMSTLQHHPPCNLKLFVCQMGCIVDFLTELGIPPRGSVRFQNSSVHALSEPPILPSLSIGITVKGSGVTLAVMTHQVCDTGRKGCESVGRFEGC